jgi:5-methylthioribose kinase
LEDAKFHKLDVQNAAKYVESLSQVASLLGGSSSEWKVEEIGDGNMNFVFIIRGTQNSVIIKQVL